VRRPPAAARKVDVATAKTASRIARFEHDAVAGTVHTVRARLV